MALEVFCTNLACRRRFVFPDTTAGKSVRCQSCGETFVAAPSDATAVTLPPRRAKAAPPPPDLVGSTLGRFVVGERLGAGAFGTVYRAFDPVLDRDVALKVPNPGVTADPKRVERFLREAKATAQLRHPHIVAVFDAGKDADRYYIASAFIDGKPLSDTIPEGGAEFAVAARQVRELAEALAYAHEQGVVHRDVKPANVMVDALGRTHLMDFGLASRGDEEARITHDGAVMGTAGYMAPEQAAGQKGEARPAVDQYAAGVVLYEMLTSHPPFEGRIQVVLHNVIHTTPDAPRTHRPDVPKDLETICLKAMAKRPEDRYADCRALADDLRRWLDGEPIAARRLGLPERLVRWVRKEPKLAAAVAAVAVVLMASMGMVTAHARRADVARRDAEVALADARTARDRVAEAEGGKLGAIGTATEERARAVAAHARADKAEADAGAANARAETADKNAAAAGKRVEELSRDLAAAKPWLVAGEVAVYARLVHSADKALREGKRSRAAVLLDLAAPELRGWEWRHLSEDRPTVELCRPGGRVTSANFSPSGRRVVTAARGGKVQVWDTVFRQELLTIDEWEDPLALPLPDLPRSAVFRLGGSRVLTAGVDRKAREWDVETGKVALVLEGHTGVVYSAAYSPDGKRIATAGADKTARVWDANTGKQLAVLEGHFDGVLAAAFSPDGSQIVTGGKDKRVLTWDANSGWRLHTLDGHGGAVLSVAYSPDGRYVVSASADGTARMWDANGEKELLRLGVGEEESLSGVSSAAFSPDGKRILTAAGGKDGAIRVWHAGTGTRLLTLRERAVFAAWNLDGKSIVAACAGGEVRVFSETSHAHPLIGRWELSGAKEPSPYIEFIDKGTVVMSFNFLGRSELEGTYKLDGNKLEVVINFGGKEQKDVFIITKHTDDELILRDQRGKEEKYRKIQPAKKP